jgi:hypothetical protein
MIAPDIYGLNGRAMIAGDICGLKGRAMIAQDEVLGKLTCAKCSPERARSNCARVYRSRIIADRRSPLRFTPRPCAKRDPSKTPVNPSFLYHRTFSG